jgi:uncharacterized ferredoxin-like protein
MIVFWRRREKSCYKVMFMLGLVGMTLLLNAGLGMGSLLSVGSVYCMHPRTAYVIGLAAICELF